MFYLHSLQLQILDKNQENNNNEEKFHLKIILYAF